MLMDQSKRNRYIVAGIAFVAILTVIYFLFIFHRGPKGPKDDDVATEVRAASELEIAKRPYVTLTPTADGAEIIVSIENMGAFDKIEYELTYLADNPQVAGEKIQRGATGTDVNTKDAKYKKDLLLGTASRGVKSPDKGIEDGKLLLHLFKSDIQYDSETEWSLVELGTKSQEITDKNGNFKFNSPIFTKEYWAILADTVGVPPKAEFDVKNTALPTYGIFSIAPKFTKKAQVSIKIEKDGNYTLYLYHPNDSTWGKSDSTYNKNTQTLTSQVEYFSSFVVVAQ